MAKSSVTLRVSPSSTSVEMTPTPDGTAFGKLGATHAFSPPFSEATMVSIKLSISERDSSAALSKIISKLDCSEGLHVY